MPTWHQIIEHQGQQSYLSETLDYVKQRRAAGVTVFPPDEQVFNAFTLTDFAQVKVVILGQDPYHGANQAHGLCFSVLPGVAVPPSLKNIYKELVTDIEGFTLPNHGFLQPWAEQGVLLLNTVLTVESGEANSHQHLGWEQFTDVIIAELNEHREGVVFLLWGSHAQKKGRFIDREKHHVLSAPHPSPLAAYRGFFGCRHFSKTNDILLAQGKVGINWQV